MERVEMAAKKKSKTEKPKKRRQPVQPEAEAEALEAEVPPGAEALPEEVKTLRAEHLYRLELLYAKRDAEQLKAQNAELRAAKLEAEASLQVRALRKDAALHGREATRHLDAAKNYAIAIAPEYDMAPETRWGYDDESGVITIEEEQGET
jgi:hypothetical protein